MQVARWLLSHFDKLSSGKLTLSAIIYCLITLAILILILVLPLIQMKRDHPQLITVRAASCAVNIYNNMSLKTFSPCSNNNNKDK